MEGKVQCDSISFEEFYAQYPNDTIILPKTVGVDGTLVHQLILTSIIDLLAKLVAFIGKKVADTKETKGTVTMKYQDGFSIEIPLAEFKHSDKVMEKVNEAHSVYLQTLVD